jgi:Tat protein secretion system quality control protein TatD with DNase activity
MPWTWRTHPGKLFATAGVHPHHAIDYDDATDTLRELAHDPEVRAVGETGLDYNRNYSPRDVQLQVFERQLQIAVDVQKPLFLHQRDAHEDFIALLRRIATRYRPPWCIALPIPAKRCATISRWIAISASPAGSATNVAARICANWCARFRPTD